jgi:integral membrane sensor domain MASE1
VKQADWRLLAQILLVAIGYAGIGKLFVLLSSLVNVVALVYPPEGLALAAGLWLGRRVWPGVFLGELLLTVSTPTPPLASLAMSFGNTADMLLGVAILRGRFGFSPRLERLRDVIGLTVVVAAVCAPLSATVGVTALWVTGELPASEYSATWCSWWLANVIGQVLVAPALLTWLSHPPRREQRRQLVLAGALAVVLVLVCQVAFGRWADYGLYHPALLFAVFPSLIWMGVRCGPREAATAAVLVVLMALEATASGIGPFSADTLAARLVYLDIFMIGAAVTALWVAALFAERRALEVERVARARLEGILLAARTMEHELGNKLAVTLGWTELLAANPALPASLRSAAEEALDGAVQATTILRQLQALSRVQETNWGPDVPPTIDLARSTAAAAPRSMPTAPVAAPARG